jgi:hypothetical protein
MYEYEVFLIPVSGTSKVNEELHCVAKVIILLNLRKNFIATPQFFHQHPNVISGTDE